MAGWVSSSIVASTVFVTPMLYLVYSLNTAIRRNNYCELPQLKLRTAPDTGLPLELKGHSDFGRIKAHSVIKSTMVKKDRIIRHLICCETVSWVSELARFFGTP
jgi:hypothetical protein